MSYSKSKLFQSGSNGNAATTTNTNSDSLSQTASAGTMVLSSAEHHGTDTLSQHVTGTSTNGLYAMVDTLGGLSSFTLDLYIKLAALPSAEETIARLVDSSNATQASLSIGALGQLTIRNAAGTSLYSSPSGKRIATGAWVHVIWDVVSGTSGTQRSRWFPDGSGTATDDSTTLTSNNGANPFATLRSGPKAGTTTATIDAYLANMQLTGSSPAVASAGADQTVEPWATVTLDASGSSSGGTWSLVSNTSHVAPTLSSNTAVHPTYTAPGDWHAGSAQTWRYTLLDGTTTDDVVITVEPATIGVVTNPATNAVQALQLTVR